MKRLLLFLVFVSTLAVGQVKTSGFVHQVFPGKRSDVALLTLHGSGEGGAADGSQFSKALGYGYAKMAAQGWIPPVDLIVAQALPGPSYSKILPSFEQIFQGKPRMSSVYDIGYSTIGGIGWSMGAEILLNQLSDPKCKLKFVILIGAQKVPGSPDYSKMADIPVLCVVGTRDAPAIPTAAKLVARLNANENRQSEASVITVDGADHAGSMRAAYDPNTPTGKAVMDFILRNFKPPEVIEPKEEPAGVYLKGDSVIYYTPTGRRAVKL